jgi:hypothetical protein
MGTPLPVALFRHSVYSVDVKASGKHHADRAKRFGFRRDRVLAKESEKMATEVESGTELAAGAVGSNTGARVENLAKCAISKDGCNKN